MMWKLKCLDMFYVPLPLLKEREEEGEVEKNDKKPQTANDKPQTNLYLPTYNQNIL